MDPSPLQDLEWTTIKLQHVLAVLTLVRVLFLIRVRWELPQDFLDNSHVDGSSYAPQHSRRAKGFLVSRYNKRYLGPRIESSSGQGAR